MNKVKFTSIPALALVVFAGFTMRGNDDAAQFRLAAATTRSVTKTLDEVGTIEPVSAASVAFPVAGKVASIAVSVGAAVTRGQVLASLDPTSLQDAVDTAQAGLDQARLTLANAQTAQSSSNSSAQPDASGELQAAQEAVLEAQRDVDEKLGAAQAALASAADICAAIPQDGSDSSSVSVCQSALSDVLTAQRDTAGAQGALSAASNALNALIEQQSSRPSSNAGSTTPSAADLAAYQKAVDAAAAAVAVANQALAAATVVSPIDGTIESVDMAVGDSVTAASSTALIRVVGAAGYEVTAIVGVDKLADVKLGQPATVTPDASSTLLTGQVVAIGAPRTANGSTTYPVSIGLDDDSALRNGTVAAVAITTGSAATGLAVPTSAVHVETNRSFVYVVDGSATKAVDVVVGVVGRTWTQIKSGLTAGQQVVLADLNEPLPGNATSSSNNSNRDAKVGEFFIDGPPGATGRGPQVIINGK